MSKNDTDPLALHRLLLRQLRRSGAEVGTPPSPEAWARLLQQVDRAYSGHDDDRYLLERSMDVSSAEMRELYEQLRQASASELARERDRFELVLDTLDHGVLLLDAAGRVELANREARQMLGGETVGADALERLRTVRSSPPRAGAASPRGSLGVSAAELLGRVIEAGETVEAARACLEPRGADAAPTPITLSMRPARLADGTPGCVVAFSDATEIRLAEAAREAWTRGLREAHDAAVAANEAKSQFLANVSHELRTPLTSVIGVSELLATTSLAPAQSEFVDLIQSSADTLLELINRVLDLSKIESGKLEVERVPFELQSCIEGALDVVAPAIAASRTSLHLEVLGDLPARVVGDPGRLRQVLHNLLANAAKFTDDGEILLRIQPAAAGDRIRFEVIDTGIGIPDAIKPTLFRAFTQADTSTTRRHGGSGLGLAIVKQLLELMDGTIEVDSRPGEGSTFRVEVPFERVTREGPPPALPLVGTRVLVIASSPTSRRVLSGALARLGLVPVAASPSEVRGALRRTDAPPQVIVWDAVHGAAASRGEVVHAVRATGASLLTVHGLSDTTSEGDHRLRAPVRATMLASRLEGLLAQRSADERADRDRRAEPSEPKRLLLVEDNPTVQHVVKAQLTHLGFVVDTADDGLGGLEALERDAYSLVLMDGHMPHMDGFEATRALRAREAERGLARTPVVALTADITSGIRERCERAGMDSFLSKPATLDQLKATMNQHLGRADTQPPAARPRPRPLLPAARPHHSSAKHRAPPSSARLGSRPPVAPTPPPAAGRARRGSRTEDALDASTWQHLLATDRAAPGLVAGIIRIVFERIPQDFEVVEAALAQGATDELWKRAHLMQGSLRQLGAIRAADLARRIEGEVLSGSVAGVPELLAALHTAWTQVEQELRRRVAGLLPR